MTWRALTISPMDSAGHVIKLILNPRVLSDMASYAVASTIHPFISPYRGDGRRKDERGALLPPGLAHLALHHVVRRHLRGAKQ